MSLPGWSDAAKAQLSGSTVRPAIFFRVAATTGPLRMWGGVGDFPVPADGVEASPVTYQGLGTLLNLPAVSQLINGLAERIEFGLSGVSDTIRALAADEADTVRGASCLIGFMALDNNWQPLSPMAYIWEGVCDVIKSSRQGDVRTITLSVGSIFNARRRAVLGYWTDAQQRLRSPDDAFCDHVALYNSGTTKRFKPRAAES